MRWRRLLLALFVATVAATVTMTDSAYADDVPYGSHWSGQETVKADGTTIYRGWRGVHGWITAPYPRIYFNDPRGDFSDVLLISGHFNSSYPFVNSQIPPGTAWLQVGFDKSNVSGTLNTRILTEVIDRSGYSRTVHTELPNFVEGTNVAFYNYYVGYNAATESEEYWATYSNPNALLDWTQFYESYGSITLQGEVWCSYDRLPETVQTQMGKSWAGSGGGGYQLFLMGSPGVWEQWDDSLSAGKTRVFSDAGRSPVNYHWSYSNAFWKGVVYGPDNW